MSEKKNIENLFREKLDAFEANPPQEVWDAIEFDLKNKEKKRRIIPFWWKLSGVASLFVVGYTFFNFYSNTQNTTPLNSNEKHNPNWPSNNNQKTNANDFVVEEKESPQSDVVSGNNSETVQQTEANSPKSKSASSDGLTVVHSTSDNKKSNKQSISTPNEKWSNQTNLNDKIVINHSVVSPTKPQTSSHHATKDLVSAEKKRATLGNENDNKTIAQNTSKQPLTEKSTTEKMSETVAEEPFKKQDSTSFAVVEPNALEELLKEKEQKSTQKQKINRWLVSANVAPIYFGSFVNGSPIDESLKDNKKTYNTSMSYGLQVAYAIDKKWNIRTGVHYLSFSYNTQDLVFYQDLKAEVMKNINPTQQARYIQIQPLNNVSTQLDKMVTERFDGVLNQQMGYIEMPVELSYKLLNKRFGVLVTGGFSSLFLNKNDIYLNSDGANMRVGNATNLNNFHLSSNIGLGLNYTIFKHFDARIEPAFKYQINAFSSDSGSFKPYIFGIYSGISYNF